MPIKVTPSVFQGGAKPVIEGESWDALTARLIDTQGYTLKSKAISGGELAGLQGLAGDDLDRLHENRDAGIVEQACNLLWPPGPEH